jgi:stage II sporulation protein M
MDNAWRIFWQIIKDNKKMNWRATIIFVVALIAGLFLSLDNQVMIEVLEQLSEVVEGLDDSNVFSLIQYIFINNATVALLMILLGFIFAIVPFFVLVFNGVFIGFFTKLFLSDGGSLFEYFVSLAPHGILELPAIVLAGAYGFKLGSVVWNGIKGMISGHRIDNVRDRFASGLREMVIFIIGILIMLLIAAIIESTISLWLTMLFN